MAEYFARESMSKACTNDSKQTRPLIRQQLPEVTKQFVEHQIPGNRFDLGGDSLVTIRAVSRVIKQCQLKLPSQFLCQAHSIAEMAAILEQSQMKRASDTDLEQTLGEVEAMTDREAHKTTEI